MFSEGVVRGLDSPLDLLVDSGTTEHMCGRQHFAEVPIRPSKEPRLLSASGASLTHVGQKDVRFRCGEREAGVTFEVVNVVRPILSVSRLVEQGFAVVVGAGEARLQWREPAGTTLSVPLRQRAGLYFLSVERPRSGLAAPQETPAEDLGMEGAVNGPAVEAHDEAPAALVEMCAPTEPPRPRNGGCTR